MVIPTNFDFKNYNEVVSPREALHAVDLYGMLGAASNHGIISGCGISLSTNTITIAAGVVRINNVNVIFAGDSVVLDDALMASGDYRWVTIHITPGAAIGSTVGSENDVDNIIIKPTDNTNLVICSVLKTHGITLTEDDVAPATSNLSRLSYVDHAETITGEKTHNADIIMSSLRNIVNPNIIKFNTSPTVATPVEGDVYWDSVRHVLVAKADGEATMQVGLELWDRGWNSSGVPLLNGSVVYPMGINNGLGDARLALANSYDTATWPLALTTVEIADGASGQVTVFGDVNDIDTSPTGHNLSLGPVYLSDTVPGGMTSTPPTHPSIKYLIGFCKVVHATEGVVFVMQDNRDIDSRTNGTFRESHNCLATESATTVIATLQRGNGGGDLTMQFSDGKTILDCTPPITITLTLGTDSSPQMNYVYIPVTTKILTVSTTGYPTDTEHIKVSDFLIPSAAKVLSEGAYITRNWNDHDADINTSQGHDTHISERLRRESARWFSGIDGIGVDDSYFTLGVSSVLWESSSGIVYQLHRQAIPAYSMTGGKDAHIVNWNGDSYHAVSDLFLVNQQADGTAFSPNKFYNLVFWMPANKSGESSPLMVNVPNGVYTNETLAQNDSDSTAVYEIPREFGIDASVGFLIARVTIQYTTTGWNISRVFDLRTTSPTAIASAGAVSGAQNEFVDTLFRIYDNLDNTKQLAVQTSGIATLTTRTWTAQDKDITVAGLADITADIATHTAAVDPHGDRAYSDSLDHDHATPIATHAGLASVHHAKTVSSEIVHNSVTGLNDGAVYNHMTDAQIGALHPVVTTLTHTALTGKNDEADIQHLTALQVSALHAEVTSLPIGSITGFTDNSTDWDLNTTYRSVGHLPLAGGTLTGNLLTNSDIIHSDNINDLTISGGNTSGAGANLTLFGGAHATLANDIQFRVNGDNRLYYDHSITTWDIIGNLNVSAGIDVAGNITTTGHIGLGSTDFETYDVDYSVIQGSESSIMMGDTSPNTALHLLHNAYLGTTGWLHRTTDKAANMYMDNGLISFRVAVSGTIDTAVSWLDAMDINNDRSITMYNGLDLTGTLSVSGNVNLANVETPIFQATDLSTSNVVWMGAQNSSTFTGNNSNIDHLFLRNNTEIMRLVSGGVDITGNVHVIGSDISDQFIIENTDGGSASAPDLVLYRNSTSPIDTDNLGLIQFRGRNTLPEDINYASILANIVDTQDGSEDAKLSFYTYSAGSNTESLKIQSGLLYALPTYNNTTANVANVHIASTTGLLYRSTSSRKYKTNIENLEIDSSLIYNLRGVSFDSINEWETDRYFGLIAEEVYEHIPQLVQLHDDTKEVEEVRYSLLPVLLLEEMKKMKVENNKKDTEIVLLNNKYDEAITLIHTFTERLEVIENK